MPNLDIQSILILVAVVINFFWGLIVFVKNYRSTLHRFFCFVIVGVVLWGLTMVVFRTVDSVSGSVFWSRLLYATAAFIPFCLVYFCYYFLKGYKKLPFFLAWIFPILFTIIVILSLSPGIVIKSVIIPHSGEKEIIFNFKYYILYFIYITLAFSVCYFLLLHSLVKGHDVKKIQIKYIFWGTLISSGLGMLTNLLLPTYGIFTYNWFGQVAAIVFIASIAYAIIKHRLMNIRLVITRSFLFSILVLIVSGAFTVGTLLSRQLVDDTTSQALVWINIIVAVIVVLTLNPLRNFLGRITDKIFFKGQIDHQQVTQDLSRLISTTLERDELLYNFSRQLKDQLKLKSVDLLYCHDDPQGCSIYYAFKSAKLGTQDPNMQKHLWFEYQTIIKFFKQYPIIKVREEEERRLSDLKDGVYSRRLRKVVEELEARGTAVVVPIVSRHKEKAFIFIGNKVSGDIFDDRDIKLLELIKTNLSLALDKSSLYEEARQFNVKLKQKVEAATAELRVANTRLRQLDKAKTLFLSVASHQLRTPLSGIKGFLSMVVEGDFGKVPKQIRLVLEEVYANTNRLIRLVNTFLNVSRIEAGRLTVLKQEVDLVTMAKRIVAELNFSATDKGLKLSFECEQESVMVTADSDKVEDVLINFVDNAIKYTAEGEVIVQIIDMGKKVRVAVKDTGHGLEKGEVDRLFNKFVRGKRAFSVHTDGSGLGLYIAKRLIDLHRGKIGAESAGVGKGSTFWFELPKK